MARKKGLTDFNLALIRYLMRSLSKDVPTLAEEIDYSVKQSIEGLEPSISTFRVRWGN